MTNPEPKENLWKLLASATMPSVVVDFPRFDANKKSVGQVKIKTLTHDDHIAIQKAATFDCDRSFKEDDKTIDRYSPAYKERYDNIASKHFVFKIVCEPTDDKPIFPTPDHVGKVMTNDEITLLLTHYRTLQDQQGPILSYMLPSQFDEWVEKLASAAEGDGAYFLDRILREAQVQLLMSMAKQLWTYRTDNLSPTAPPNESTSDTTKEPTLNPEAPSIQ